MHGFVIEPWHSRHGLFSCERATSSMLEPCAISSACLVSCWSVVFGSWHSCLEFRFRVGVRTLVLHVLSHFVSMRCRVRSAACFSVLVLCCVCCFVRLDYHVMFCALLCGTSFCFSLAACFHVIMSCLNTWLMSFLISYMFVSCFAHGLWFVCWPCACVFVLCEHMAFVLVFSVSCALIHLVTWLLVNLPHLSSFVTLLICSLYNLLVFAVLCQFGIVSPWMYSALPCPALSFLISYMFVSCFAHGLWFVCWPCACVFVLCEHMAFVLVFSVSCALIHLVTWLLVNLPHLSSFVTLLICSLYNLLVFAVLCQFGIVSPWMYSALPCPALSCPVLSCPVLSCPVLSCPVLSCPVLSCPVLSCPVLSSLVLPSLCLVPVFPQGVVFVVVFVLFY